MDTAKLPLEYLLTSSQSGLEGFELGRLNQIANLRKELRDLVDEWVQAEIEAELARWLLESRRARVIRGGRFACAGNFVSASRSGNRRGFSAAHPREFGCRTARAGSRGVARAKDAEGRGRYSALAAK